MRVMVCVTPQLGLLGAERENARLLVAFESCALLLSVLLVVAAILALLAAEPSYVAETLNPNCRALVQVSAQSWLRKIAPGIGCDKYYDTAHFFSDGTVAPVYAAGQLAWCFNRTDAVCTRRRSPPSVPTSPSLS